MNKDHPSDAVRALLHEYGSAMRGDWNDMDGGQVEASLGFIAGLLDQGPVDMVEARSNLSLCPHGRGHWRGRYWYLCDTECSEEYNR